MAERGRFIVFEGIDGSGKSTQAAILARRLDEAVSKTGRGCTLEEEPDSREILGGLIRSALHGGYRVSKDVLAYLYAANRIEHINRMLPTIEAGEWIVCDRYFYSNMAYNRTPDLDMKHLYELNRPFAQKLMPDVVVYVGLSPEEAARRRNQSRWDVEIFDELEKQREIAQNYDEVFEYLKDTTRVLKFDGSLPVDELANQIWNKLTKELGL